MSIRELLAKKQRKFIGIMLLAWALSIVAVVALPGHAALVTQYAAIAVMLVASVSLYRTARCPRCSAKLWLSLHKLAPLGPFQPRLNHCPACGVSTNDPAEA